MRRYILSGTRTNSTRLYYAVSEGDWLLYSYKSRATPIGFFEMLLGVVTLCAHGYRVRVERETE